MSRRIPPSWINRESTHNTLDDAMNIHSWLCRLLNNHALSDAIVIKGCLRSVLDEAGLDARSYRISRKRYVWYRIEGVCICIKKTTFIVQLFRVFSLHLNEIISDDRKIYIIRGSVFFCRLQCFKEAWIVKK